MSEYTEITDAEIAEFTAGPDGQAPSFHPILMVWREILKPAREEQSDHVTAGFANRIVTSYREIDFKDMNEYRDRYFAKILELAEIVDEEIATDDQCLSYTTPEEDVEHNSHHYKALLMAWQLRITQWEMDWDCTAAYAGVELAAISEVHKMFFGQVGVTAYLDNIRFQFTEADQAELATALQELKDSGE